MTKELKVSFAELCIRGVLSLAKEGYKVAIPEQPEAGKNVFDYIRLMKAQGYEPDSDVYERADYVLIPLKDN